MTARLEKLFFFTLALCPFAMGAVYALVNMTGGWARFIDGHDYAFYGMSQFAFEGLAYAAVLPIAWLVSVRFPAGPCSRRCLVRNLVFVFAASVALRLAFFLFCGNGTDVSGDALWAWERARGMPVSDNRHVLFPAWMNYALFMKAFVSVFGERLDLFQLMAVPWGGLGSAAVLLLTRELTRSERVSVFAGLLHALPRKIVSFVSRLCVRLFYGKSVWDVNTPYRLMRTSAFADFYSAIPPATFAPNVILSGLAARNGLRALEIRVPQHDRMTGEVSIRKWKLLRCAAKSFLQTVAFSFGEEWNDPG